MDPLTFQETAGRAHYDLEQRQKQKEVDRAKNLRLELQKKLGEDTASSNTPRTTLQIAKPPLVYQASGSSSGQPAPYSQQEWNSMQRAYGMGRERERHQREQEEECPKANREQGRSQTYGNARGTDGAPPAFNTPHRQHLGNYGQYHRGRHGVNMNGAQRGVHAVNTPWVFIDEEEARQVRYYYTVPL